MPRTEGTMTRIGGGKLQAPPPSEAMSRRLVLVISILALSVPISGLLVMVCLALVRPAGFIITLAELACIAVATILIAAATGRYVHRER